MASVVINGERYDVADGERLIDVCDRVGVYIPRFCYHPNLSVAGNCRMCLVEIEGMPKLQISCNTNVRDGMSVLTDSQKVKEARADVLEFIFINHPLDCPICDQAGECKLQDYYMEVGLYKSRMPQEFKVKKPRKAIRWGSGIVFDAERCVLCTRCVRFMEEVVGKRAIGVTNRGDHEEIALLEPLSTLYAGNLADICPVGALTSEDFRFKMRVWFLSRTDTICPGCSRGCNITAWHKDKKIYRFTPRQNDSVNHAWMCDIGRYSYKEENSSSLILKGWVREGSGTKEMATPELLGVLAQELKGLKGKAKESSVAALVAPDRTNEEIFTVCAFMAEIFGSSRVVLDVPAPKGPKDDLLLTGEMASNPAGLSLFAFRSAKPYTIDAFKQDLKEGKLEAVMLFGDAWEGLEAAWPGMQEAFKALPTLAIFASKRKASFPQARFVIPSASMIQKDGTWVNVTGHVQRVRKAYRLNRDILADGESLGLLAEFMGESFQVGKLEDITKRFLEAIGGLSGASLADVGLEGVSLPSEEQPKHLEA